MAKSVSSPRPNVAAIYARYSSLAQRDVSIDDQVAECAQFAASRGLEVGEVYADRAISGRRDDRPQFQRMLADAKAGWFSAVIVYKLDRFARDRYASAVHRMELKKCGVELLSATEPVVDGPEGIILQSVIEGMNEFYSANLSVQVRRGMVGNAKRCLHNGRRVFGYDHGEDGRFVVDPVEGPLVREMFDRYVNRGQTSGQIAVWLNSVGVRGGMGGVPSRPWVLKRLHDECYTGVYIWSDVRVEGGMPQLVDRATWDAAQRGGVVRHAGERVYRYTLVNRIFDLDTGKPMAGYCARGKSGKLYTYYAVPLGDGHRGTVRVDDVDRAVAEGVVELLAADGMPELVADRVVAYAESLAERPDAEQKRRRVAELERANANLLRAVERGIDLDGVAERSAANKAELEALRRELSSQTVEVPDRADVEEWARHAAEIYDVDTVEGRSGLLENLVESVVVDRDAGTADVTLAFRTETPPVAPGSPSSEGVSQKVVWCAAGELKTNTVLKWKPALGGIVVRVVVKPSRPW